MVEKTEEETIDSSQPLRVLILEDSPNDAKLAVRTLQRGRYEVQFDVTDSAEVFRERLEKADYDVILADFNLRGWTAFEALEILKQSGKDIPLIVSTGSLGDEAAAECIKQGAADFILKDRPARLPAAVKRALEERQLRAERKRAEEALNEERNLFLTLMDNLPDVIYFKDRESRFTRVNQAQLKQFGLSEPAQAVGKTDFDFYAAEHAKEAYDDEQAIMRTGQPIVGKEEKETWADGHITWVSTTKMPLRDFLGNVTGTFGISRDITERKQAEEALRRSEACLAAGESLTHTGSWSWDIASGELFWSQEAYRIFGFDPAKDRASFKDTFLARIHPEDRARVEAGLQNPSVEDSVEYRIVLPDGSIRFIHDIAFPVTDAAGNTVQRFGVASDVTERKLAEEALHQSEEKYRSIVSNIPDVVWTLNANLHFVFISKNIERMSGFSIEEINRYGAKPYLASVHPDDAPKVKDGLRALFEEGRPYDVEVRTRRKDGEWIWVHDRAVATYEKDGILCADGLLSDITGRKRAEEAMRESEERFRQIAETIEEVFWTADPGISRMLYISPAYERIWGRPCETLYENPKSFLDSVHPDDREHVRSVLQAQAKGESFDHEYRIITPGGVMRRIWDRGFPISDEAGRVIRYVGVAVDITGRKQAEEERARLVTAIEQSAEGVVITNPTGVIEYVNPAFTRITGYSREEALGQNPKILKSERQDPAFYRQLWETILTGEPWSGELINQRKDKSLYTEQMSIAPVKDAQGEITHFIATKQDVTERRHLEAQLQQAAKMEAVGRLAGGVAHDFNNLLTVINGYSEILLGKLAGDESAGAQLHEIFSAGERAAALTRQLLAFSRRQVLAPRVLDLNAVVSNLEKMLRRLIGEDVKLRTNLDPHLERVKADPGQIEQVIMNLAVNARDAMPLGGNLILETSNVVLDEGYARNHPTVKPGPHVMLAVSDTGVGMPPETQARIFEPFFTTKEIGKGTGLGLATVYGIVKQSGGSIWVYSEMGQGTAFKVYLPVVGESQAEVATMKAAQDSASGTETVLVVEDEDGVRSLVRLALASGGYHVLEAKDAESAMTMCAVHSGPIHLLLTDVVMPQMSGPALAKKLIAIRHDIKVLYMSGYTDDAVVHHGVLSHDMPFIQKPFSPVALRKKVQEVLGGISPEEPAKT